MCDGGDLFGHYLGEANLRQSYVGGPRGAERTSARTPDLMSVPWSL